VNVEINVTDNVDEQASIHADGPQASAGVDGNSVNAGYDNTIGGGASIGAGGDDASGSAYINAQTGQQGNFDAGLDGNNVYVDTGASSMTEAHAGGEGQVSHDAGPIGDVGASAGVDGYVQQGMSAGASGQAGENGVAASGEAFAGTAAGVDGTGTIDTGIVSTTASGGVSIGEQVGVGGGGEATYNDGQLTLGVSGDAAALVGLDVDVKQSVDVGAAVDTGEAAVKASEDVAKDVTHVAKDAGSTVTKTANKAGKSIKKMFSDIGLKENIVPAGVKSGINLYTYNYVWDKETRHTGVIAQELLGTKHAGAVEMHVSGYYQVDYSKLPI
jgi:hypothetical protein